MYREPGSVRKFVPLEHKPVRNTSAALDSDETNMTKEDLQKKWGREFIDNDRDVLEFLEDGYAIYQRFTAPMATWLRREGTYGQPNVTGAMFRRFKREGFIDHVRDEKPYHAIYEISKHGLKTLETYRRKEEQANAPVFLPEPIAEPVAIEAKPVVSPVTVELKGNYIRTAHGNYILTVEFDDFPTMVKGAAILGVRLTRAFDMSSEEEKIEKVKKEKAVKGPRKEGNIATCDFCKASYRTIRAHLPVWLRYCRDNKLCHKEYAKHRYLFMVVNGRAPTPEDRDTSLPR